MSHVSVISVQGRVSANAGLSPWIIPMVVDGIKSLRTLRGRIDWEKARPQHYGNNLRRTTPPKITRTDSDNITKAGLGLMFL
jgi:hypothetical protein